MKVLYIGSERSEAQAVANALRTVDESVSVLWAAQLENAVNWLGENRGLDALVMDAPIDGASCLVVQKQLRRLALPPAVVFLVPDGIAPTLDSLHPGGHYLRRNESLARDLPIVVTRALEIAARTDLEQQLARATSAREDAEQRQKAAADQLAALQAQAEQQQQAAADQLAALQAQYEVGMARADATWDMVDEQLRTAAREVESARQREASAAAELTRLAQRESELSSQLAEATAAHSELARQLADARSAVEAAQVQTQHERDAAAAQLRERERDFDTQLFESTEQRQHLETRLAHALDAQRDVEARLADAVSARSQAEHQYAAALNDVARLTAREAELNELI